MLGSAFDVVCYVFDDGVWDSGVVQFEDKFVKVHGVKCFGHVQCYGYCSEWWLFFVESGGDCVVDMV